MIDEEFYKKINLWGSIVIGALCYGMFFYLLYISATKRGGSYFGALLFLVLAANCTNRIRSYFKIERLRKNAVSEKEVAMAERRSGIVNTIFSNATIGLYMLLMTVVFLTSHLKDKYYYAAFCAFVTLCVIAFLVIGIGNLKRFDRR